MAPGFTESDTLAVPQQLQHGNADVPSCEKGELARSSQLLDFQLTPSSRVATVSGGSELNETQGGLETSRVAFGTCETT
jgi:hypothetical protein